MFSHYLQANKLDSQSFMDYDRRYKTYRSEIRDTLLLTAINTYSALSMPDIYKCTLQKDALSLGNVNLL